MNGFLRDGSSAINSSSCNWKRTATTGSLLTLLAAGLCSTPADGVQTEFGSAVLACVRLRDMPYAVVDFRTDLPLQVQTSGDSVFPYLYDKPSKHLRSEREQLAREITLRKKYDDHQNKYYVELLNEVLAKDTRQDSLWLKTHPTQVYSVNESCIFRAASPAEIAAATTASLMIPRRPFTSGRYFVVPR